MDIVEFLFVMAVVGVAYLVKGITGLGGPSLAVPVLAGFLGVEFTVAVIAIPTAVSNVWLVWENRAEAPGIRRFMIPLLVAGFVGTIVGVWVLVGAGYRNYWAYRDHPFEVKAGRAPTRGGK